VLATGGYDHNKKLATQFEQAPDWNSACPPYVHGDHFVLAGEVGAAIASVPPTNLAMFYGYSIPGEEHEGVPLYRSSWECGCPHAIWVNQKGERFCDESFYKNYQPRLRQWDGDHQTQPNIPPFLIFDQNYRDKFPLGSFMPGSPIPEELAVSAATPRELAQKLGIDPTASRRRSRASTSSRARARTPTSARARAMGAAARGRPELSEPCVGALDKPPYFGVRLVPVGVGINSHGLETNDRAQVMHLRGHPIAGLYAVGNSAALARPRRRLPERHLQHARHHLGLHRRATRRGQRVGAACRRLLHHHHRVPLAAVWDFVHEMDNWAAS